MAYQQLSNTTLIDKAKFLTQNLKQTELELLSCISEIKQRKLYVAYGFSNLALFCVKVLGMSEDKAWKRSQVVSVIAYYPQVTELLKAGRTHLSLDGSFSPKEPEVEIKLKLPKRVMEKLERAHGLMLKGNNIKNRVEVIEAALDALLDKKDPARKAERAKKRLSAKKTICPGATRSSSQPSQQKRSRYIPAAVRHELYQKDLHQCNYVSGKGQRCSETSNLQIDHIKPFCLGGGHTPDNLRLLCPAHNRLMAGEVLGHEFMRAYC